MGISKRDVSLVKARTAASGMAGAVRSTAKRVMSNDN